MAYEHLHVDRNGPVATVTFNRPDRANALNFDLLAEIEAVSLDFREDAETRVVIFTGAGRHFSSGADLTDPGTAYQGPLVLRRRRSRIPTTFPCCGAWRSSSKIDSRHTGAYVSRFYP